MPETTIRRGTRSWRCPECHVYIDCPHGRVRFEQHVRKEHPERWEAKRVASRELMGMTG